MGVVTRGAALYDPLTGPRGDTLAVGATHPILFLSEMALTTHLIGVIHIHTYPFFNNQKVTLLLIMAGKTG